MAAHSFQPNDLVVSDDRMGVRGQVLWSEGSGVYVCWETGYELYTRHHFSDLEKVNALDLIVEGRETLFEFCPKQARCPCGRKTSSTRHGPRCGYCDKGK